MNGDSLRGARPHAGQTEPGPSRSGTSDLRARACDRAAGRDAHVSPALRPRDPRRLPAAFARDIVNIVCDGIKKGINYVEGKIKPLVHEFALPTAEMLLALLEERLDVPFFTYIRLTSATRSCRHRADGLAGATAALCSATMEPGEDRRIDSNLRFWGGCDDERAPFATRAS